MNGREVVNPEELAFLSEHSLCRLATASEGGMPHVVPVVYAMDGEDVLIAMDYGTKKLKNLRENLKAAVVVDETNPNRGVLVQGECELFERGPEYLRLLQILFDKFVYFRNNPWGEGESPILRLHPAKVVMWKTASRKGVSSRSRGRKPE